VPEAEICRDYAQSQICLWPLWEKIVDEVGGLDNADPFMRPDATAEVMQYVLSHLDQKYGGIQNYLASTGITENIMTLIRQRLT